MRNAQWVHIHNPFELEHCTVNIYNGLMVGADFPFLGRGYTAVAENLTIDSAYYYMTGCWDSADTTAVHMTNCIAVGLNALGDAATNDWDHSMVNTNTVSGIFKTVGAGSYYLADVSTNRDIGTTNIDVELLSDLRKQTTYPPVAFENQIYGTTTNFAPQAKRDTNAVDRGYHYDSLDYVFAGVALSNCTLTFSPGTAVGYGPTAMVFICMKEEKLSARARQRRETNLRATTQCRNRRPPIGHRRCAVIPP